MLTLIDRFEGDFRWLSNFWESPLEIRGRKYSSVEHFYQASKALTEEDHEYIRTSPTPGQAKKRGREIHSNPKWESLKEDVMLEGLRAKFAPSSLLGQMLLNTRDARLVEGNTWGDCYWGVCKGVGKNRLGHLLMKVRQEVLLKQ